MLTFDTLTAGTLTPYLGMTFPLYQPVLHRAGQDPGVVALAASVAGQPVGLALAELPVDGGPTPVRSLVVAPPWRGFGIGGALLGRMEEELRERGAPRAWLTYLRDKPATPALERILARRGWDPAETTMLHLTTSVPAIARAPWMRFDRLPAGFSLFPWGELSAAEYCGLRDEQEALPWIPPELVPWRWGDDYDRHASLGLRYAGKLAGWLIVHPVEPGTLRFSTGWVRPELQRGRGVPPFLPLCIAAFHRAMAAGVERGVWDVSRHQGPMIAFARKWMLPYADNARETMITGKFL